jgi:hypothetical protein
MGLTVHYTVSYPAKNNDVIDKMEGIRQKCLDLPFGGVSEVKAFQVTRQDMEFYQDLQRQFFFPNNTEDNLKKRNRLLRERGLDIDTMIFIEWHDLLKNKEECEIVRLTLWAGEGCEPTNIVLSKSDGQWSGSGFTKTQYATEFVKCHLLVMKALELLQEAGFVVGVHDEGGYWETRDLSVLAKNINAYTDLVSNLFGALKESAKNIPDATVVSPIEESKNYMVVKDPDKNE